MPPIAEYLDGYFKPFLLETFALARSVGKNRVEVEKARCFEKLVAAWFQSVFCDGHTTLEDKLGPFFPTESLLARTRWLLDPKKFRECPWTITEEDLVQEIRLNFGEQELYFPANRSASVDVIISPEILDEGGNPLPCQDVLIGIQVNCMTAKPSLGRKAVLAEAEKFAELVKGVNNDMTPSLVSNAVLIMYCTCEYTKTDFEELKGHHAIIWNTQEKRIQNIEVIILNLATSGLRENFFKRAIPPGDIQIDPKCAGTADALGVFLKFVERLK